MLIERKVAERDSYSLLEQDLARYARSIGHPARVAVILAIAKHGKDIEGEIIDVPQLSQATVIQHLRELKRAGIIQGRIFGAKSKYGLDWEKLKQFKDRFDAFIDSTLPNSNVN